MLSFALVSFIGSVDSVVHDAKPRSLTQRAKTVQKGMLRAAEAAALGGAVVGALSGAVDCDYNYGGKNDDSGANIAITPGMRLIADAFKNRTPTIGARGNVFMQRVNTTKGEKYVMGAYDVGERKAFFGGVDTRADGVFEQLSNASAGDDLLNIGDNSLYEVELSNAFSSKFFDMFPSG